MTTQTPRQILEQIARGTHDPMPTRRMYPMNEEAMKLDEWWQEYFLSMYKHHRQLAIAALEQLP